MKLIPKSLRCANRASRAVLASMTVCAPFLAATSFAISPAQHSSSSGSSVASSAHTLRPTIAVLRGGELDEDGKAHKEKGGGGVDALNLAELSITRSHAYTLYARDLMAQQVKEIKLDSEGFVNPASAQKFGKGAGIERFLQVFVSRPSVQSFVGQNVNPYIVPTTGDPVVGPILIEAPSNGGSSGGFLGLNRKSSSPPTRRNLIRCTATIMCRFTRVATGETDIESYKGIATADAGHNNERRLVQAAIQNAFDNFTQDLAKSRTAMMANVIGTDKGMAIVDLGEDDGMKLDMAFEVCEVHNIGGFDTYDRICDARVTALHPKGALLELGDYKKELFHRDPSFHPDEDKAKLVHKGCVIQEKKF